MDRGVQQSDAAAVAAIEFCRLWIGRQTFAAGRRGITRRKRLSLPAIAVKGRPQV
jgi:hypothetical protein